MVASRRTDWGSHEPGLGIEPTVPCLWEDAPTEPRWPGQDWLLITFVGQTVKLFSSLFSDLSEGLEKMLMNH